MYFDKCCLRDKFKYQSWTMPLDVANDPIQKESSSSKCLKQIFKYNKYNMSTE